MCALPPHWGTAFLLLFAHVWLLFTAIPSGYSALRARGCPLSQHHLLGRYAHTPVPPGAATPTCEKTSRARYWDVARLATPAGGRRAGHRDFILLHRRVESCSECYTTSVRCRFSVPNWARLRAVGHEILTLARWAEIRDQLAGRFRRSADRRESASHCTGAAKCRDSQSRASLVTVSSAPGSSKR